MKFLFVFLFTFLIQTDLVFSQLRMKIKDLHIKHFVFEHAERGDESRGPEIKVTCLIINPTDSIYTLQFSTDWGQIDKLADITYGFTYRGYEHKKNNNNVFWTFGGIIDKDTLEVMPPHLNIYPHQSIELFFSNDALFSTSIVNNQQEYMCLLLETLPTFRIYYKDPGLSMVSTEIMGVTLDDSCEERPE
ncbi:hypothetical protein [Culturomica massiliensis]|uniref:hypothetical protein n=1 Tax=Culturomica massiliensis TaxID=1841857 RepID=UPI003AB3FE88